MGHLARAESTSGAALRQAMISYSWRILGLSIVISLLTATLIFGALQWQRVLRWFG